MKTLTKYESAYGALYNTPEEAQRRDALVSRCSDIAAMLPPGPRDSGDRVEHDPAVLSGYRRAVVELCRELYPTEAVFMREPEAIHPFSYAGRFLGDAAPTCVNRLWNRLMCCGGIYEYEQPYYALNPDKWTPR